MSWSNWTVMNPKGNTLLGYGSANMNVGIIVELEGLWSPWSRDEDAGTGNRWYTPTGSTEGTFRDHAKWCAILIHGRQTAYPAADPRQPATQGLAFDYDGFRSAQITLNANFFGKPIMIRMNDDIYGDNQNHPDAQKQMKARYQQFNL